MNTTNPDSLDPNARSVLRIVFITLFIDLVGFSIIFPLFPSMLAFYQANEAPDSLFGWLHAGLERFTAFAGAADQGWGIIILFGGMLGSIYSLLQFLCTPLLGALSDRYGRRPVLIASLIGLLLSYALWFFARSFTLLLLARFIGGIMSANISTATAIVADVTTPRTRSKGMAIIGIAFGLGFILGPALGGISSLFDLTAHWPGLAAYGVNPYSMAAAVAVTFTFYNLISVAFFLPETRPLAARDETRAARTIDPRVLLSTQAYPGVSRTNLSYFLFLLAFSGMEFSLTFLAVDRLQYTPLQNTYMFLFIGLVLTVTQGTYVRRQSVRIGSKAIALQGLAAVIPGLTLVGLAGIFQSSLILYAGLLLLAAGSAMATPCLTALASVYTPENDQGRILGIFRSLGALARAVGPLFACVLYWRLGPSTAYFLGAAFLLVPLLLTRTLPLEPEHA